MWFKNLVIYRLQDGGPALNTAELADALASQPAADPAGGQLRRLGFTAPAGRKGSGRLLHDIQGHRLISVMRGERMLPTSVVREEVDEQVEAIETAEGRKVTGKEKTALKEKVTEALMPRAFVRHQRIDLWWDRHQGLLAVNTSSRPRAEETLTLLRETLGSLKAVPLATAHLPVRAMTAWLTTPAARPDDMLIGHQVELAASGDDSVLRARQVDLDSDDIQQLLEGGRKATRLGLGIEGRLEFVLHDDLTLKGLKFNDALLDDAQTSEDGNDVDIRLETDFILMAQTLSHDIQRLTHWLGGPADPASVPESTPHQG